MVEAKPEGTTLSGVAEQSEKYLTGIPEGLPHVQERIPFSYESTGIETLFRDTRYLDTRSRLVFAFHKPETLKELSLQNETLRTRLKEMQSKIPLNKEGLRDCQFEAIQNLVMEYSHERAVADGVNVGYEVYCIKTDITEKGSKVESGYFIDKRDKLTRKIRWEQLDEPLEYVADQLDRSVVAQDQIRTVIRTFKEKLYTEIFPGRTEIPKTLVFAKDDSHAEDIVHIMREEFGKGNDFCKKITYKTAGEKPEDLIASFRNSYNPRIAVTVDMISTGTDIKPLECLLFMRDVKSRVLFEQMKGRGTRTISSTDFKAITPGACAKTHFMIVDAAGVCENDKTDSRPLERKKSVPFDKLIMSVALGNRDEDTITSLAGRLARMDREIEEKDRKEIQKAADGQSLKEIISTCKSSHLQSGKNSVYT